jgi:hypothetical protein
MNKQTAIKAPTVENIIDEMDERRKRNIAQRLNACMAEVDYVQKEKKSGMNYSIVSHDAVTAKVRPILQAHGVVYYPRDFQAQQSGNRTELVFTVRFENIDDRTDYIDVATMGFGVDQQDKGPGKAISYGVKYALLKVLGLETGDDPDEVQDNRANHEPAPARPITGETPPAKRVKLDGPYTSKTQLWGAVKAFVHAGNGMGDLGEWIAYRDSKEVKAMLEQCERDYPALWSEGLPDLPEYEPLEVFIARRTRELEEIESLQGVK